MQQTEHMHIEMCGLAPMQWMALTGYPVVHGVAWRNGACTFEQYKAGKGLGCILHWHGLPVYCLQEHDWALHPLQHKLMDFVNVLERFPEINQIVFRPAANPGRPSWLGNKTLVRTQTYSGVPLTFSARQSWTNFPALIRGDFFRSRLVPGIVLVAYKGKHATAGPWQEHIPPILNPDTMHMLTGLSMYGMPDMPRVATHLDTQQENCTFLKRFLN